MDKWRTGGDYYGTGTTFVMSISPKFAVHRWTFRNEYFICTKGSFLAVGGGQSGFALWLDPSFEHGTSNPCDTFDSPCLAHSESFLCARVELWSLGLLCTMDKQAEAESAHEDGFRSNRRTGAPTPRVRPNKEHELPDELWI